MSEYSKIADDLDSRGCRAMTVSRSQPSNGHTPTPWQIKNEEAIKIADSKGDSILSMYHTHLRGRRPTNEVEANAAFIVEAVNSHAALVKALEKIADLVESEDGEPLDDAIKIANDALASHRSAKP